MDLEDLTQYLSPLLDLDDWMISGDTTGDITWHASNEGQWLLDGSFQANDLSARDNRSKSRIDKGGGQSLRNGCLG